MLNEANKLFYDKLEAQGVKAGYPDVHMYTLPSEVLPAEADVRSSLTRTLKLNVPIIASPMDSVVDVEMAIAMAELGGIAYLHRNMPAELVAKKIRRVKKRRNGIITSPFTVPRSWSVAQFRNWHVAERLEHIHRFPVSNGAPNLIVGLLSVSDLEFCMNEKDSVEAYMTGSNSLQSADPATTLQEAHEIMRRTKTKALPLFASLKAGDRDDERELVGMYSFTDTKQLCGPTPTSLNVDGNGQLVVGCAVGANDETMRRVELAVAAGVDIVHVDVAHGAHIKALNKMTEIKREFPKLQLSGGNISKYDGFRMIADTGADAVFIGQGCGATCTTRIIAGVGVPQVSAMMEIAHKMSDADPYMIADGGIRYSGDIAVAVGLKAKAVVIGTLLAATDESPGEKKLIDNQWMKPIRGMGSLGAMSHRSSQDRYGQAGADKLVPEGEEGYIASSGPVANAIAQFVGGLRASMGYTGSTTLDEHAERCELFRVLNQEESHPRILISAASPNYRPRT